MGKGTVSDIHGNRKTFDPAFQGPIDKRSCRDVLFLIVFIAYWVGMFVVAGIAFANGNPKILL
jgi:hypothetical protein